MFISILERTDLQQFDSNIVEGAGIITSLSVGHRKTAISELDVLLSAIRETSVLLDSVQMYNCTQCFSVQSSVQMYNCTNTIALSLAISAIAARARGSLAIKTQLD